MHSSFFNLIRWTPLVLFLVTTSCSEVETVSPVQHRISSDGNREKRDHRAARTSDFHKALAQRWAPIHYQDVDVTGSHGLSGKADYVSAINFDNDWVATNNWNNLGSYAATGHCYFSVVETGTHWFITYAFFHPRDWTDNIFLYNTDEHENDLEGFLSIVKKNGTTYGALQGVITVAHTDFYSFVPAGSPLQSNQESIDGTLSIETFNGEGHPVTAQEAKGHGLKAYPYYQINGGDGLKYFPSTSGIAEAPSNANDRDVKYKLVDIFETSGLWEQRFNTNLFVSAAGQFKKSYGAGNANAPWKWDDGNDGSVYAGELATDPAKVVNIYFKNLGTMSFTYVSNQYKGI